jgi:hypothetical protein
MLKTYAMNRLTRYWFLFEPDPWPNALNLGCGVSAYGYDDALALLHERVFKDGTLPRLLELKENVDISLLDDKHVRPNMENPTIRGIWYPMGYAEPAR